jgi:predicted nuclease of predicted toxin-antitoxin system
LHTLDLPDGNRTSDTAIIELACRDDRIVITKDADFVSSHLRTGRPPSLLLKATVNMGNAFWRTTSRPWKTPSHPTVFIELGCHSIVIHS